MPLPADPPRWNVFLSSTVRDLESYRDGVRDTLRLAEAECYPSEDWVNPFGTTLDTCRRKFDGCNGYLLLLGFWHGTEVPALRRTVTQEEFRWARERAWPAEPPPMAVLVPEEGSRAERELRANAARLKQSLPDDAARAAHDQRVAAWHGEVLGDWRTATKFHSREHLEKTVLVLLRLWDPPELLARTRSAARPAAAAARAGERRLTPVELGLVCRQPQFEALRDARAAVRLARGVVLGLVAHGGRGCGGEPFLERLAVKELRCGTRGCAEVPQPGADALAMRTLLAQTLGLPAGSGADTPALAQAILQALHERALGGVITRCAAYPGGLPALEAEVWRPLVAALQAGAGAAPPRERLTVVFADFSGRAQAWLDARGAPPAGGLQPLPVLGDFDRIRLLRSFEALHIATALHDTLLDRTMQDEAGVDDPEPARALARLAAQPVADEDDEEDPP